MGRKKFQYSDYTFHKDYKYLYSSDKLAMSIRHIDYSPWRYGNITDKDVFL